ncbi:MAG: hypothetical protein CMP76_16305 [Flavobacterium sp.]|uniref:DUF6998 domain-containing protein n=1 Tax=Flavobacterium sp. TaxID=239 RepID=UPI000C640794|nr:hypothetical protein [Flavobacterium sp.]MBF04845.1 hypothetical protein [Flavobacterium sp.]|tara:strand:+ start:8266 stop:8736 length:471 start_codon:yes stop_codon:yes gene_type:complete
MREELEVLFGAIETLKDKYKQHNKKFTLDGKLVGDVGEVLVAESYGLTLYGDNNHTHDGFVTGCKDKQIQIKASFNKYFYFTKDLERKPKYFIAIQLRQDGSFEEIYNGTGELVFNKSCSHLPADRKHPYRLSVKKLRELNKSDENVDRICRIKLT